MNEMLDATLADGTRLTNVYGSMRPDQADQVVRLWLAAGVLSEAEARRRLPEVVYTFHGADGELIGVNTVYVAEVSAIGKRYYFYRTFIRAASRGSLALPRLALDLTYRFLKRRSGASGSAGVAVVTDNLRLTRRRVRDGFAKLGFHRLGPDTRGRDIWYQNFDGTRIDQSSHPEGNLNS